MKIKDFGKLLRILTTRTDGAALAPPQARLPVAVPAQAAVAAAVAVPRAAEAVRARAGSGPDPARK